MKKEDWTIPVILAICMIIYLAFAITHIGFVTGDYGGE